MALNIWIKKFYFISYFPVFAVFLKQGQYFVAHLIVFRTGKSITQAIRNNVTISFNQNPHR